VQWGKGVAAKELALLTRQIACLLQAGLPLVEGLEVLRDETSSQKLNALLTTLVSHIREGQSLATALEALRPNFPEFYIQMVRAGEASGRLEEFFFQLADFWERQAAMRHKIVSALLYPAIMSVVGLGVVMIIMTFVVPRVTVVFSELNETLPWPTQVLIGISELFQTFWPAILLAIVGSGWACSRYLKTTSGRERVEGLLLKLPLVGHLIRLASLARFSSTLAILLNSGIPLLVALDVAKRVTGIRLMEQVIETARQKLQEGGSLGAALRVSGMVPLLMVHLITVGEKGGTLEHMLHQCASLYETEVDQSLTKLGTLVEPLLILGMGGFVFFLVMAVLLPLMEMSQMVR